MKKSHTYAGRLFLWLAISANAASLFAIPVWINEIDYDNPGTDNSEFIELAGLSGTSLDGYKIVLYNGSNGETYGSTYSFDASDTLGGDANQLGAAVFDFSTNGIQNGPDGIALIFETTVVQFLSYEGAFTAKNGIANGMVSENIGVSEMSDSPESNSLQLVGRGQEYEDFTWVSTIGRSKGERNADQIYAAESVPDSGSTGIGLALALIGLLSIRRSIQNRMR